MIFVDTIDLDISMVPYFPRLRWNYIIFKAELENLSDIVELERVKHF